MKEDNRWESVCRMVKEADMVLVGIGDELSLQKAQGEEILGAYHKVAGLVQGKPWFAVTVNTDDLIFESELNHFFVVAPCGSEKAGNIVTNPDYDETWYLPQWEFYTNWLASTLGKKLCILELGVGLTYPSVIRLPFEKTAIYNQKSTLVRVHSKLAQVPESISERSVCISRSPIAFLNDF